MIHLFVSNVEHLFDTVSANFIQTKWHTHTEKAALLSSLNYLFAIVISPTTGWLIDKCGVRMMVACAACCLMGFAHLLLGLTYTNPILGLSLLSLPEAVMPTILRASVPLVVRPSVVGFAYGTYEAAESLGKSIGAPLIGYVKDRNGGYMVDEIGFAMISFTAASLCVVVAVVDKCRGGALNGSACAHAKEADTTPEADCGPHHEADDDIEYSKLEGKKPARIWLAL